MSAVTSKFDRSAVENMTLAEREEWTAIDVVNFGSTGFQYVRSAQQGRERLPVANDEFTPADIRRRRRLYKRAVKDEARALGKLANAYRDNDPRFRQLSLRYFSSFSAKLVGYHIAWKKMKPHARPHICNLPVFARELNIFKKQFEVANLIALPKSIERIAAMETKAYRPVISFGIHHRACQQMVLRVLRACRDHLPREDQYCRTRRGRPQAVRKAIELLSDPDIQFVAVCDVKDFFPSIGEKAGPLGSVSMLHEVLDMLPRSVIETTVMTNGVLASTASSNAASLEALTRDQYVRTGVPQGSAVSAYLGEYVMSGIMSLAEELHGTRADMVNYADDIAIFGPSADDVNAMYSPLAEAASSNQFGSFELRKPTPTRHKAGGLPFLGYYLIYDNDIDEVRVEVSERNQDKLAQRFREAAHAFRRHDPGSEEAILAIEHFRQVLDGWIEAFDLTADVEALAEDIVRMEAECLEDYDPIEMEAHLNYLFPLDR